MECSSCGIENLPTSVRCYDCGFVFNPENSYLQIQENIEKKENSFVTWLKTLPLPSQSIEGEFQSLLVRVLILPLLWIPGMAQWAMDQYEKGLALLILTVIPLLIGFTQFNHWISNLLLPLGITVYLWALIDGFYTWRERHQPIVPSIKPRINALIFLIVALIICAFLWSPDVGLLRMNEMGFEPDIQQNDYLLLNKLPRTTRTYFRKDLIAIQYSNTTTVGRIIGFPKETIYLQKNQFYSQGFRLDDGLIPLNENGANKRIDVPANHYFIFLDMNGRNLARYNGTAIIPAHAILGRIEGIVSPASHRKRLF